MKNLTPVLVLLGVTSLVASPAFAQAAEAAPTRTSLAGNVSEQHWSQAGTYEWQRPEHVRFVLLRGCGGGGGGGGAFSIFGQGSSTPTKENAAGGGGGSGAAVSTILLGPLTAASYTVVVGTGGAGAASSQASSKVKAGNRGVDGAASTFTGTDIAFVTPGGRGGHAGVSGIRLAVSDYNGYENFVSKAVGNPDGNSGGGSGQAGKRGLLGLPGAGNVSGDSGGGGGSLRNGGAGGDVDGAGSDGDSCAGGGGAGYLPKNGKGAVGGRGGDGSVMLLNVTGSQP